MEIGEHKCLQTGSGSILVTLPKWWTRLHQWKGNDLLIVSLDGGALGLEPKKKKGKSSSQPRHGATRPQPER